MRARPTEEVGMIGKLMVFWLLVLALFAVAGADAGKIAWAHFHVASIASNAVSDAAASYRDSRSASKACAAAAATIAAADASLTIIPHGGCKVDPATGGVTITVSKHVNTLVASRLSFTKKYTTISDTETATPPSV
jgi:hypothetical protein